LLPFPVPEYIFIAKRSIEKGAQDTAQSRSPRPLPRSQSLFCFHKGNADAGIGFRPSALKNQPFFDKAQKDDQVLIYSTAKEAICTGLRAI